MTLYAGMTVNKRPVITGLIERRNKATGNVIARA
jgi:hypothetical protein